MTSTFGLQDAHETIQLHTHGHICIHALYTKNKYNKILEALLWGKYKIPCGLPNRDKDFRASIF